jgi:hypothetical protein
MKILRRKQNPKLHLVFGTMSDLTRGNGRVLVTAVQARNRLGLSEGGFRLLTGRGELLPVAQLGKAELYLLEDVEAVAAQRAP